jgi:hypothetical protein
MVLLAKPEETLLLDGLRIDLSYNRYTGVIHPQGHLHLKEFRQDQFPVFVYDVDGLELEQLVIRDPIRRARRDARRLHAGVRPLIAFRDYHSTTHENGFVNASLGIQHGSQKEPNCSSSRWAELPAEYREVLVLRV